MKAEVMSTAAIVFSGLLLFASAEAAAPPPRTYAWLGELVAADSSAAVITVKVRIPEHVAKYTDRFKAGDRVVVVWDMIEHAPASEPKPAAQPAADAKGISDPAKQPRPSVALKTESDAVLMMDTYDASKTTKLDMGYILPAEFVATDSKTVTLKVRVPAARVEDLKSVAPGKRIRATTSMDQPSDVAAITSINMVDPPAEPTAAR